MSVGSVARLSAHLVALVVCLAVAAPAWACSCNPTGPALEHPGNGADDVPLDVVLTSHAGSGGGKFVALKAPDGTEISLVHVRDMGEGSGCGNGPRTLSRPETELSPETEYELVSDKPDEANYEIQRFRTGRARSQVPELTPMVIDYYRLAYGNCEENCRSLAELLVSGGIAQGAFSPTWVEVRATNMAMILPRVVQLGGQTGGPSGRFALELLAGDGCVSVDLFDERGELRDQQELCEPDRCAIAMGLIFGGSCGPNVLDPFGARLWDQVVDDSCSDPPRAYQEGQEIVVEAGASSCAVHGGRVSHALPFGMLLIASTWLRRRARRAR